MKIKVIEKPYEEVAGMESKLHIRPIRQSPFFRKLMKTLSAPDLKAVNFTYETDGMDRLKKDEPALFLMNHSSFTDLEIAATLLSDRQYHIICTNDGLVGKAGLMSRIGCIPAKKFISDMYLVKDMKYAVDKLNSSILMYPEASYSFDGCETPLPDSLGKFLKLLKVPVIMIRTKGSFLRDPLYNCLQKRNVTISAKMSYLLSPEEIEQKSTDELNRILADTFKIDNFREQVHDGVIVSEPFRADGLHRVLFKCPECETEGEMAGEGIKLTCKHCGASLELTEEGKLTSPKFKYVSDWYKWERDCVHDEIVRGDYLMELDVDIIMMVNFDAVYKVGKGKLIHDINGFTLTGCNGALNYHQSPKSSYSLYADYYWYELGDMISIGDQKKQFYCIPTDQDKAIVAKARLAAEEMYKVSPS
ncbi:MAG: 1-acyl-sn-glycerol-3-phosphate acyltransferase [Lachnospiraceae bacterium]|nr:1-acyl-sn-glycerol-3-phosphate acyltransferase [Lachnospiraceae bacterium]